MNQSFTVEIDCVGVSAKIWVYGFIELQPVKCCPCCGSMEITVESTIIDGSIRCRKCGISVRKRHETLNIPDGVADALITWNRRYK